MFRHHIRLAALSLSLFLGTTAAAQCGGTVVASHTISNGANLNFVSLSALNEPVLGSTWNLSIDHSTFMPLAVIDFYVIALDPAAIVALPFGQILVDMSFNVTFWSTPGTPLGFVVPASPLLCGAPLYVQGASLSGNFQTIYLTNRVDGLCGDI